MFVSLTIGDGTQLIFYRIYEIKTFASFARTAGVTEK